MNITDKPVVTPTAAVDAFWSKLETCAMLLLLLKPSGYLVAIGENVNDGVNGSDGETVSVSLGSITHSNESVNAPESEKQFDIVNSDDGVNDRVCVNDLLGVKGFESPVVNGDEDVKRDEGENDNEGVNWIDGVKTVEPVKVSDFVNTEDDANGDEDVNRLEGVKEMEGEKGFEEVKMPVGWNRFDLVNGWDSVKAELTVK